MPDSALERNWLIVMRGIFVILGSVIVGGIGWALGDHIGIGTALLLSCVGSGFGMYWGRRLFDEWLG